MFSHNPSNLLNGLAQYVGVEPWPLLQRRKNSPEQQQVLIECASRVSRSFCIRVLERRCFAVSTTQDLQRFSDEKDFDSCFWGEIRLRQHCHVHHIAAGPGRGKQEFNHCMLNASQAVHCGKDREAFKSNVLNLVFHSYSA